jgi:hypothetical protein
MIKMWPVVTGFSEKEQASYCPQRGFQSPCARRERYDKSRSEGRVVARDELVPRHAVGLSQRPTAEPRACRMLRQRCSGLEHEFCSWRSNGSMPGRGEGDHRAGGTGGSLPGVRGVQRDGKGSAGDAA